RGLLRRQIDRQSKSHRILPFASVPAQLSALSVNRPAPAPVAIRVLFEHDPHPVREQLRLSHARTAPRASPPAAVGWFRSTCPPGNVVTVPPPSSTLIPPSARMPPSFSSRIVCRSSFHDVPSAGTWFGP